MKIVSVDSPNRKRLETQRESTSPVLNPVIDEAPAELDAEDFRRRLMPWYRDHARVLPWRGIDDPYATWLSEIMLQQTQVATVTQRYIEFLRRFPTLHALAAADQDDVLALWSGLGYYRRARMLHRAAQFVVRELDGHLPKTAAELRTLPGIGEYTAAAIASIAFGESVAVVDGNVERVLLRVSGHPEDQTAAGRMRVVSVARSLVPAATKRRGAKKQKENAPGDHNQAMMELGATICVPRGPLCLQCPVVALCRTRGEHLTVKREKQQSRRVAYLLALRQLGTRTEVLLEQRPAEASLMPGMFELPPLPLDAVEGHAPVLRVRHAITNTNYAVEVFPHGGDGRNGAAAQNGSSLLGQVPGNPADLHWASVQQLGLLPLTGLARKCLVRSGLMEAR
jgi:A/G-specific adenine glycosylase